MANRLVSVDDNFDFPKGVADRQAARLGDGKTAEGATLAASYAGRWRPATAYAAGITLLNPMGDLVTAKNSHTSGATYDDTLWALGVTRPSDSGQRFMSKVQLRSGTAVVALLGDSTGDEPTEWFRTALVELGAAHPKVEVKYWGSFDNNTKTYAAPVIIQDGLSNQDGIAFKDTFSRTGALAGTVPDIGGAWVAEAGANALYSMDGSKLNYSSGSTLAGFYTFLTLPATKRTVSATFTCATGQNNTEIRLAGQLRDASNLIRLVLSLKTASTIWRIDKVVGGVTTVLATGAVDPIPLSATPVTFPMSITIDGLNVSGSVNGQTISGSITQADRDTVFGTGNAAINFAFNTIGSLDNIQVDLAGTGAVAGAMPEATIHAYNASVPGSDIGGGQYNVPRNVFPETPDLVLISYSHNHGGDTPAVFVSKLDGLVNTFRNYARGTGVALSSQNPRIAPAPFRAEHLARLVEIRTLAETRKWGYIAAGEAFQAQPSLNGLVNAADGIHPTIAGSVVWKNAAMRYFDSLKAVTS